MGRALATTAIVVVALLFTLQLPVHAQEPDQAGTVALSAATPQVGVAITATLTDPDGGVTGTTWLWSSSDTLDGTYAAISGATSASYTPVAADHGKYLKATASYTNALAAGKSAEQVADNAVANVPVEVDISVPDASVAEGELSDRHRDAERRPQADRRDPDHNDEYGRRIRRRLLRRAGERHLQQRRNNEDIHLHGRRRYGRGPR